ncbi:MAG: exosortase/archaeosortase family protein [Phycisphaerales bacterium]|nr:MAG: exosortase/archaeosortase family protein [Phycisphaerales bacterium]
MSIRVADAPHAVWQERSLLILPVILLATLIWSYWPTLLELAEFWQTNEDYSVCQLVPLVGVYLVWRQRHRLSQGVLRPSWRWGLVGLAFAQAVRFAGVYYAYGSAERYSLVFTLWALVLLLGGWSLFRRMFWILCFLLLMIPLPQRVHDAIALPLQGWATFIGASGLELLGFFVWREGNVVHVEDVTTVMVAEACSGLRMLTAFVFTTAVLCFVVKRPRWQYVALMLSSIPVAIISNGLRVLGTGVFMYYVDGEVAGQRFHDIVGLLMMPFAIVVLLLELRFLSAVVQRPEKPPGVDASDGPALAGRAAAAKMGKCPV